MPQSLYINTLLRDLSHESDYIQGRDIQSIYLGGGTPTLFDGQTIYDLLKKIRQVVPIVSHAEITIEANPESVTTEKIHYLKEAGINRISLGIQSLQDIYLERLGRSHTSQVACQAIESIVASPIHNFNVDIMYGLPGQTNLSGLEDIKAALVYKPPHLSWYQLTIEPNTAFFKQPPVLPCDDSIALLQAQGIEQLEQSGLIPYEIAAFSQPGFECYHNNHYWTFGDYIGIGAGAHSKVTLGASHTQLRYVKPYSPNTYLSVAQDALRESVETIALHQLPFEFMLNALRRYQPVEPQLFEERTGLSWELLFPTFEKAADKQLIEWDSTKLVVTPLGRRFYNDLVSLFL